ncbi:MAG: sigma-70 family RNA polymerase sigma factor [Propionibacteriaceae bacterium]|jgi:RNA polymerase sigma factor (sigma-70 family)|nr:sigma-70 family RNA polymerase sigma factor [Propionibacteriaceae bacterium]
MSQAVLSVEEVDAELGVETRTVSTPIVQIPPFTEFVESEYSALAAFAVVTVGDKERAMDILQDALFGAFRNWRRIENPGAYIRRSIVNGHRRFFSRRREWAVAPERFTEGASAGHEDSVAALDWAMRAVARLPKRQRAAVVARVLEDRSYNEVAAIVGCTPVTARSLVSKGLAKLRNIQGGENG